MMLAGGAGAGPPEPAPAPPGALPGAEPISPELARRYQETKRKRGSQVRPRTRHLAADGSARYTNRLFLESSPYLLQHAHNPVDWRPWGDEAFATAARLDRPVLLSVGYSTCHWCHVMEEESFEDEEIARTMNESYVAVKVDREERPDVDAVYLAAVQSMSGGGGWPMTVWLTPDRRPFFGGTYFPPRDGARGADVGFLTLLRELKGAYDSQRDRIEGSATEIVHRLQQDLTPPPPTGSPGPELLGSAAKLYEGRFDPVHGGVGAAPKFPSGLPVRFLLRCHRRTGETKPLEMAVRTLDAMAAGGIHDQVGGGFHRYATDAAWLVPHFEKMLYDNALLALAYLEAHQATGEERFARVARDVLRHVERDMTSPEGAFYSATDADSLTPSGRQQEGYFFTWTPAELEAVLGSDRARLVAAHYGVTKEGNFEGRSIPHLARPIPELARELRLEPASLRALVDGAREELYRARSSRRAPLRDEKVLAAWNGLMVSAFARAAFVLADVRYAQVAARAADFVLRNLRRDGRLRRSFQEGQALHAATLDDHAFLAAGLLDLFETTGERRWLEEAIALDRALEARYEDRERGGFFMTADDGEKLLAREKPAFDGAEPSGNSVHLLTLLRLHELTSDRRYLERAERGLRANAQVLARSPGALSEMLLVLDFHEDVAKEIVIVTPRRRSDAEPLLAELRRAFVPNRVLAVVAEGPELEALARLAPLVEGKVARGGRATAYVCERRVCALPTSDPKVFAAQLRRPAPAPPSAAPTPTPRTEPRSERAPAKPVILPPDTLVPPARP